MIAAERTAHEVTKDEPCPICSKPDWCFWLPDGAINCKRSTVAVEGWVRAKNDAPKDHSAIFQPKRNRAIPRSGRSLPAWQRTQKSDDGAFEKEIIFQYSETQRVVRKQWSDRRSVYKQKSGKLKSKLVIPQHLSGKSWEWGRGPNPWPLYRADDLRPTEVLFFVGGETCVETLRKWGFSATCNQGGEGNRVPDIVASLKELRFFMLVIIPDNDEAGMNAAEKLIEALVAADIPSAILSPLEINPNAPQKWDVADWSDHDAEDVQGRIKEAVARLRPVQYEAPTSSEKAQNLREATARLACIEDSFERFVTEQQIALDYGARGRRLDDLVREVAPPQPVQIFAIAADSEDFLEDLILRQQGMIPPGISTGFYDLDAVMGGGLQRSDLDVWAGRPSMGKSSAVLSIARNVASISQMPVPIFSLEMNKRQIRQRYLAADTGIPLTDIRMGQVSLDQVNVLAEANDRLNALPLFIDTTKRIDAQYIEDACKRVQDDTGQPLGMVVVDYLTNMKESKSSRFESVSQNVRDLKDLAGILDANIGLVSQLSREVEKRNDKRPMLSDLRETGELEQQADSVHFFYREEHYNPDTPNRGITEVITAKGRNSGTGTTKLLFEPQFVRFRNLQASANIG